MEAKYEKSSGSCGTLIGSKKECEEAWDVIGFIGTGEAGTGMCKGPKGCFYGGANNFSQQLCFNYHVVGSAVKDAVSLCIKGGSDSISSKESPAKQRVALFGSSDDKEVI